MAAGRGDDDERGRRICELFAAKSGCGLQPSVDSNDSRDWLPDRDERFRFVAMLRRSPWLEPYNKSAPNSAIGALLAVGCWLSAAFADRAIQVAGKSYPSPRSWSERCHRE